MATQKIRINRAPVLTLWATVVAERSGYDHEEALTLGKAVAGLNAQSKGQRLGIYEASDKQQDEQGKKDDRPTPRERIQLLGRAVPVTHTKEGLRATSKGDPISAESVERYLQKKFGEHLPAVREAMQALAKRYDPEQLADKAYDLYEQFRPAIPEGKKGWGAAGELDLEQIRSS
jgi:hypothetical protein